MLLYRCWLDGIPGYGCADDSGWRFIADPGFPGPAVRRGLAVHDLVFAHPEHRRLAREAARRRPPGVLALLGRITAPRRRASVAGLLFLP